MNAKHQYQPRGISKTWENLWPFGLPNETKRILINLL